MSLLLVILFGGLSAWLAHKALGRRGEPRLLASVAAGALGAAMLGVIVRVVSAGAPHIANIPDIPDINAWWRVSTVFVGAVGIIVIANRSTGGRLR